MKINPIYLLLFSLMSLLSCNKEADYDEDELTGSWTLTNIHCIDGKIKNSATDTTVIGTYTTEILESNATITFSKSGNLNVYKKEGSYSLKLTSYFSSLTETEVLDFDFATDGNWYIMDNMISLIGNDLSFTYAGISKFDENNFEYHVPSGTDFGVVGTHTGNLYFTFKKTS